MNQRIANTPLSIDARGSSVRVVVAADKYTVANISEGMNDRQDYARLFAASPQMLSMLQQIARMTPYTIDSSDDALEDAVATMNSLIENSRQFLKFV